MSYNNNYNPSFYNNFTFQGNIRPPPNFSVPPPPHYGFPPQRSQPPSDHDIIKTFESKITTSNSRIKQKPVAISSVREHLRNIVLLLKQLQDKESLLKETISTMSEEEWGTAVDEIKQSKVLLDSLMLQINDTYLDVIKSALSKRSAKRLRLKKINEARKRQKMEMKKQWEERSRKIDEDLQEIKNDIDKAKQGRHHPSLLYREAAPTHDEDTDTADDRLHHHQGISRQQLINSPCPICGDKISGFHYGIFSCESCKGFFKRTVQNRKNYMCLRGGSCPVTVATRKKCPACRFDKCLGCGMKLEAIREDRTRGGRSTYQCSYSLSGAASTGSLLSAHAPPTLRHASSLTSVNGPGSYNSRGESSNSRNTPEIPPLLQEIMDVEHLWQYNESEVRRPSTGSPSANPLLAASGITAQNSSPDFLADLCNIADHRLYKIVKWCKSLPLFKNISIDDQICLLINSWCELLVLSCCYRGVSTPGEVRVGAGRGLTLQQAAKLGLTPCIERMLSFTDHLRRLRVDRYEYVALKVIVLLTSDASDLREAEKVRASQEKALAALQAYTAAHSPATPAKFGELLLRIPELQRTCQFFMQVGKEMLNPANKSKEGDGPSFNLLMELLRGDH